MEGKLEQSGTKTAKTFYFTRLFGWLFVTAEKLCVTNIELIFDYHFFSNMFSDLYNDCFFSLNSKWITFVHIFLDSSDV